MITEELLIGFDARVLDAQDWHITRREQFLIRTDVVRPYSTDTAVWPSVMDGDSRPATCVAHQTLWNSLDCLQSSLTSLDAQSGITIAVTVNESIGDANFTTWRDLAIDGEFQRDRRLLGYDVSDRWLLSALSNCGFLPGEDVRSFRHKWSGKLNEHHLFQNAEVAHSFRTLSNERTIEHSPFFVFGLWSSH